MSVRGWVQACEWQARGSELVADAVLDATLIAIEDTTDFDDAGGIVSVNDQTISYRDGMIDEDAGTIFLDTGLAAAATVGDRVYAVSGGQIARDVTLFVTCGDGDLVEVRAPFEQRDYWPEGDYEDPVEIVLSDDLESVESVPGRIPQSIGLTEARGGYPGTLQDIYDAADAAATAAADAAANATTAQEAANGKNAVTYSLSSPGAAPNSAGDIWFRKESATQTVIEQWQGLGGTSWQQVTLNSQVIANLDAGKLTAGSAFVNALSVKTNFTLGDAATNGVIQSYNFAGSSVGVYLDKNGLVAKGGSISGATITGSVFSTGGSRPITISSDTIDFAGGPLIQYAGGDLVLSYGASAIQIGSGVDIFSALTLHSDVIGALTATGTVTGDRLVTGIGTSASAANTYMDTAGMLLKSTSSLRYKNPVRKADLTAAVDALLGLDAEVYTAKDDPDGREHVGWYAERLHESEALRPWVDYDAEGRPDGIGYGGMVVPLAALAQRQQTQIAALTRRVTVLSVLVALCMIVAVLATVLRAAQ